MDIPPSGRFPPIPGSNGPVVDANPVNAAKYVQNARRTGLNMYLFEAFDEKKKPNGAWEPNFGYMLEEGTEKYPGLLIYDAGQVATMTRVTHPSLGLRILEWGADAPHTGTHRLVADATLLQKDPGSCSGLLSATAPMAAAQIDDASVPTAPVFGVCAPGRSSMLMPAVFTSANIAGCFTFTMTKRAWRSIELRWKLSRFDPLLPGYRNPRELMVVYGAVNLLDENQRGLEILLPFPAVVDTHMLVTVGWHCDDTLATLWVTSGAGRTTVEASMALTPYRPPAPCRIEITGDCVDLHEFRLCHPLPSLNEWRTQTAAVDAKWAALYV